MSILTVTVETTDRNVICEVADMLRRLIAVERQCECERGYDRNMAAAVPMSDFPAGSNVIVHTGGGMLEDDVQPVDIGSAFGIPAAPSLHPTTTSLLAGNGIPNYDGVPFDINTSVGSPVIVPIPPLTAEQTQTHTAMPLLPTPPIVVSGVKLDGEGLPWDRRIHASTKTLRQSDNTWKLIRGVTDALVDQVKAELRAAMGQVAVQPPVATPPTSPALTLVPPLPPVAVLDADKGWPDPPAGPVAPPTPPAPPAVDPYTDFVQFCTSNQQSGRLAFEVIKSTCEKYGITQLPMINARHDLIPVIRAELELLCK